MGASGRLIRSVGCVLIVATATPEPGFAEIMREGSVLANLNDARISPHAYARRLVPLRQFYNGTVYLPPGSKVRRVTSEGVVPLDDAIDDLDTLLPAGYLSSSPQLQDAAAELLAQQAHSGSVGHEADDGSQPEDRIRLRGGEGTVGEMIAYGADDPAAVIRQLIIDDGVPDRGHRKLLFSPIFRFAGVACGPHPVYRTMCVIDLAEEIRRPKL